MDKTRLTEWLSSLSISDRAKALALMYSYLTICARELFLPERSSGKEAIVFYKLQGLNELHHTVAGQLIGYVGDPNRTYPPDVFVNIILEIAERFGVNGYLNSAVEFAKSRSA